MSGEAYKVVVGITDNNEVGNYGRQIELSGGLADFVSDGAVSKLRHSPPTDIEVAGARTTQCVPAFIIAAYGVLHVSSLTVNLFKCRRDKFDEGDTSHLRERRDDIESVLGDLSQYPNLRFIPDLH